MVFSKRQSRPSWNINKGDAVILKLQTEDSWSWRMWNWRFLSNILYFYLIYFFTFTLIFLAWGNHKNRWRSCSKYFLWLLHCFPSSFWHYTTYVPVHVNRHMERLFWRSVLGRFQSSSQSPLALGQLVTPMQNAFSPPKPSVPFRISVHFTLCYDRIPQQICSSCSFFV